MVDERNFTIEINFPKNQVYYQEFLNVQSFLFRTFPNAKIKKILLDEYKGTQDFFEIFVNGKLIFSKIKDGQFLDNSNSEEFLENLKFVLDDEKRRG